MALERGRNYIVEHPEREKYTVVTSEPTREEIEERKQRLFGDYVDSIHPEIAELIVISMSEEKPLSFDEYTLATIVNVSEAVTIDERNMGNAMRTILEAMAVTAQQDEIEVSVNGAAENQIRTLEERIIPSVKPEPTTVFSSDIIRTEIIARQPIQLAEFDDSKVIFNSLPHPYSRVSGD